MTLAQMSARARALLKPIAEQASSSPNPLARHYYYQSEWKSCIYGQVEGMKKIAWLQLSLKTIRGSLSLFPAESAQAMELLIAFELATSCDKAEEGLEIYRKYYHGQTPETSRGALYLMRFCRVAFLARDFVTSRKMVEEFGRYQIVRTTPTIYITVLLAQALLEISEGDPDAASQTLEIAKASNQENFFLAYEVQIRALETAIALKRTDLALADQLVERNIKWLRSRKISLSESAWIYFYQIIAGIIQFKITGATIRTSLIGHFTNNFRSEHPEFFILLESEIAEVSGKET